MFNGFLMIISIDPRFPMAELGIKVFGNEISYWNAEGDYEIMKSLARLNPQLRVLEILSGKVSTNIFYHF